MESISAIKCLKELDAEERRDWEVSWEIIRGNCKMIFGSVKELSKSKQQKLYSNNPMSKGILYTHVIENVSKNGMGNVWW